MISIIQIIIIVFAVFAWSRAILRVRGKQISVGEFIFWSFIWVVVLVVAVFPYLITWLSNKVGIERGVDLALYVSVILLFYLMFRLYVKVDSQSQEMTTLVRELAIKNADKKELKKKK